MKIQIGFLMLLVLCCGLGAVKGDETSFSRDVLPILSDRCFHCHGPDESHREAELRLDVQESALADRGGYAAIVAGDPGASEIIKRITSDDEYEVMPPPDSHRKPLTKREIGVLQQWIKSGAEWGKHWAFEPPVRAELPEGEVHPIDAFVSARLNREGLSLSPRAAPSTLARRVAFDLTGMPPTLEQAERFFADDSPQAFENYVDRLLDSRHFGERMAMWWLDAARYSDTDGYQQDATRNNWPWRDWVVESFNKNKPFDQFTIEQFAGDLLPEATPEQILATCFHRNHMTNGEGGRDPEESRIDYVIDRVNTTGTVWLGLTLGCTQCHSHKFDPISQHEYYSLFAFFNSLDENGKAGGGAKPYLKYSSDNVNEAIAVADALVEVRRQRLDAVHADAVAEFPSWLDSQLASIEDFKPWRTAELTDVDSVEGTELVAQGDLVRAVGPSLFQDDYRLTFSVPKKLQRVTGLKLEVLPDVSHTNAGYSAGSSGEFILTDVKLQVRRRGMSQVRDIEIAGAIANAEKNVKGRNYGKVKDTLDDDPRNGWNTELGDEPQPLTAVFRLAEPLVLADDEELIFVMLHRSTEGNANIGKFRLSVTDQPETSLTSLGPMPLEQLAGSAPETIDGLADDLRARLMTQFLADHRDYQQAKAEYDGAKAQQNEVRKARGGLNVMVMGEREEPRNTHVLVRGVWDAHGDEVAMGVPEAVLPWPEEKLQSRLDLAKWLVDRENPLTARVIVNQLWRLCFGAGLVRTPEDFGLQGERPTHPELLDWLAVEFMEHDWDVKHLLRLIVTSKTYQQRSFVTLELLERDPENRLLARGARYRLPSWMIRDAALQTSGLLNGTLGGPPTRPYQPAGVWEEMFMGRFRYQPSQGALQHRRTLYAFWRRSAAPTFLFDAAQRRVCEVRSRRTNTPLHALTLLNDENIREASRALAMRAMREAESPSERLTHVFRSILLRDPGEIELRLLTQERQRALAHYKAHTEEAKALLDFGQPERNPVRLRNKQESLPEIAACMLVASMIYNLDEAITHE